MQTLIVSTSWEVVRTVTKVMKVMETIYDRESFFTVEKASIHIGYPPCIRSAIGLIMS